MSYCILCKEFVDGRYIIKITDRKIGTSIKASVCRYCYNKFIESKHNTGFFNISRFTFWSRDKKDRMRYI